MKPFLLISLLLSPVLLSAQSNLYRVEGKLGNVQPGAKVYVRYAVEATRTLYSDSAQVENGTFVVTGTVDQPYYAWLVIDQRPIRFYLEPGVITVTSPDSLPNAVVSGSPMNSDHQKLKKMLQPTEDQLALLREQQEAATPEQKKDKEFKEDFEKRNNVLDFQKQKIKAQFIKENPASMLSLYQLAQYTDWYASDFSEVGPMFSRLSETIKTSKPGKEYAQTLALVQASSVGAIAPDFAQSDTSGKTVSLRSFRGKYVLLDFWASWCAPCRAENPNLVRNFQRYKDKNFTILGVSLDSPNAKEAWLKAIHKDGLDWTHVSDLKSWDNEVAKQYHVRLIPQNFLVGPDGKIVAKNIQGEALEKKLAELFGRKP